MRPVIIIAAFALTACDPETRACQRAVELTLECTPDHFAAPQHGICEVDPPIPNLRTEEMRIAAWECIGVTHCDLYPDRQTWEMAAIACERAVRAEHR